ncbi:YobH family protein [Enterobacter sp. Bisph1]|uniref:YobH family protein n=1 Tax=Enterobacter sp. Bisph1 TaxID=1274399 RepID=UPI00057C32D1|nr:YobH family protein [Enterobacter sp. Bisph1]
MRTLFRCLIFLALAWVGLLLSGYGVLVKSAENAAGLGLKCTYATARGTSTAQYLHTSNGFLGLANCPLLRKSDTVIDNG